MEEVIHQFARAVALALETAAVAVVAIGSIGAAWHIVSALPRVATSHGEGKRVWRRFGMWLLLALEFELAADIVTSVVAPTWPDLGRLGAIAVIRTFLNYFLERDVAEAEAEADARGPRSERAARTAETV
jgi:uncharacterized membrane protein